MSRIKKAFKSKKPLIAFIAGGDPDIETTEKLIPAMDEAGMGLILIGIPFSDPIAEGTEIEAAYARALAGGCTAGKLFDMVRRVRQKSDIPIVFSTYMNPVFTYGNERFIEKCAFCGIDGIVIHDLPFEERGELLPACAAHGINLISVITPASDERIGTIAGQAKGFLYCISSHGESDGAGLNQMIALARKATGIPCAADTGASTPEQARKTAALADGVIVGSAIVKIVAEHGKDCVVPAGDFVRKLCGAGS